MENTEKEYSKSVDQNLDVKLKEYDEFGDVLQVIGSNGKFQKILLYAIAAPLTILDPILYMSLIFLYQTPNHWCHIPGSQNFTEIELNQWKNSTIPTEIGPDGEVRFSRCQMYNLEHEVIDCPNGWDYDRTDLVETMATEFNWVCSKEYYSTTLFTMVSVGAAVGTPIFGFLADKVGRRPIFFISLSLYLLLRVLSIFIPQYFIPYMIVIFLGSLGYPMTTLIPTMIISENCDDELRSFTYSFLWFVYVAGAASIPYIAYFASHWHTICMATLIPSLLIFLSWSYLPESPSWLTSVGRTKEAAAILQKMARTNGTYDKFSREDLEAILSNISQKQLKTNQKASIGTLFKRFRLAKHVILYTICWGTSNLIYECITLNTPNMSGDQFLNFFLLTIIEAPASFVGGYLLNVVGRRWTGVVFFLICSTVCFVAAIFTTIPSMSMVIVISTFVAKFTVNITYLVACLQCTELLPTSLRSTGTSFGYTFSACLGTLVPGIVFTSNYSAVAPYLIMGSCALVGVVSSIFLPETVHQDLPETIDAANEFGKDNPFWSYRVDPSARKRRNSAFPMQAQTRSDSLS